MSVQIILRIYFRIEEWRPDCLNESRILEPALPIFNYSQILYRLLEFTQNLKQSRTGTSVKSFGASVMSEYLRYDLWNNPYFHRIYIFSTLFYNVKECMQRTTSAIR